MQKCKCFLEADRQKLLGIVEQGFGDFDLFNNMVRHVFDAGMSAKVISRKTVMAWVKRISGSGGRGEVTQVHPITE